MKYLPERFLVRFLPELEAILQFVLNYVTLYENGSTTGQQVLGLRFFKVDENKFKVVAWILVETLPNYLLTKLPTLTCSKYVCNISFQRIRFFNKFFRAFGHFKAIWTLASFLNMLAYLKNGKFPTLTRRILNIICTSTRGSSNQGGRDIGYEYLSRYLLS